MKKLFQFIFVFVWTITCSQMLFHSWLDLRLDNYIAWFNFVLPAFLVISVAYYYRMIKRKGMNSDYSYETGLVTVMLVLNIMNFSFNLHFYKEFTTGEGLMILYGLNPLVIYYHLYSLLMSVLKKPKNNIE